MILEVDEGGVMITEGTCSCAGLTEQQQEALIVWRVWVSPEQQEASTFVEQNEEQKAEPDPKTIPKHRKTRKNLNNAFFISDYNKDKAFRCQPTPIHFSVGAFSPAPGVPVGVGIII